MVQYIILIPVVSLIIVAPILSVNDPYAEFFESQHRRVAAPWFAMFSLWSSFTNCGLSLSDTSMIPFINSHVFVFSKLSHPLVNDFLLMLRL
jgi:Trk-type K+ transport system membrane component